MHRYKPYFIVSNQFFDFNRVESSVLRTLNVFVCFSTHLFGSKDNIISKKRMRTSMHKSTATLSAAFHHSNGSAVECVVAITDDVELAFSRAETWSLPISSTILLVSICIKYIRCDSLPFECVWCDRGLKRCYHIDTHNNLPTVGVKGGLSHLQCANVRTERSEWRIEQKYSLNIAAHSFRSRECDANTCACIWIISPENCKCYSYHPSIHR